MDERQLHLVAFNVPFPADYGGVMDIFHKIRSLARLGVQTHLHAFTYGRGPSRLLERICASVSYYPRERSWLRGLSTEPFIVRSRRVPALLKNLAAKPLPILFEGQHCTSFLGHPALDGQRQVVRSHNVEHRYYRELAQSGADLPRRFYYQIESLRLRAHEEHLAKADALAAISRKDADYFRARLPQTRVEHVSAFHPDDKVASPLGKGSYALYHGNLEVEENIRAVEFLIAEVIPEVPWPFFIAGKGPSLALRRKAEHLPQVKWVPNPTEEQMERLVSQAHVHVLPTFQDTGVKLKLLHALHKGRHCVANPPMVEGTGLEGACALAQSGPEFVQRVVELFDRGFDSESLQRRELLLRPFANSLNAKLLADLVFEA